MATTNSTRTSGSVFTWLLAAVLIVSIALVAGYGSGHEESLPFADITASESIPDGLETVASEAQVLVATLVDIQEIEYEAEEEGGTEDVSTEPVGLVFSVQELIHGDPLQPELIVRWNAFDIDNKGKRVSRLRVNGLTFGRNQIGTQYLLAIQQIEDTGTYQIYSTGSVAAIDQAHGTLDKLANDGAAFFGEDSPDPKILRLNGFRGELQVKNHRSTDPGGSLHGVYDLESSE